MPEVELIVLPEPGVYRGYRDGAYVHYGRDKQAGQVQVVIKGPMVLRPGGYEEPVSKLCGKPMVLVSAEFLPPHPMCTKKHARANLRAGFISLIFSEASS